MKKILTSILSLLCILCLIFPASALEVQEKYPGADYAVVSGTASLNLRQGPGSHFAWLGSAKEGDWVMLMAESANWYYVTIAESGLSGYMSKNYLKTSGNLQNGGATGVVVNPKPTQFLNLRQYPSYSAPVLGIYYNGATFSVLSYSDGWYQVLMNDGKTGYFRQEFVSVNGMAGSETAFIHTLNGGKLNLRSTPSYKGSSILGQFANGRQVSVLLKGNVFWKVSIDGMVGYMDSAYLTASSSTPVYPPQTPVPEKPETKGYAIVNNPKPTQFLNLREQPASTAKIIAQYKNGVRFEVIEQGETWCKVYGSATGNIGYMMTKYLTLYGLPALPTKTVQNGNSYVNLRSAPSKQTGAVYQQVYSGAVVTVLIPGEEWTKVRYGATEGYMMTWFLK